MTNKMPVHLQIINEEGDETLVEDTLLEVNVRRDSGIVEVSFESGTDTVHLALSVPTLVALTLAAEYEEG